MHRALTGEAVLTVGGPVHEFEKGSIDAVVIVGPHECMPCKVAEGRFARIGENIQLPHLAVYLGGDGIDTEAIDRFAFDIIERTSPDRADKQPPRDSVLDAAVPTISGRYANYSEGRRAAGE